MFSTQKQQDSKQAKATDTTTIDPIPAALVLRRQLSLSYVHPKTGVLTNDDPASYQGAEREMLEGAVLAQLPETGYADGIRKRKGLQPNNSFFANVPAASRQEPQNESILETVREPSPF